MVHDRRRMRLKCRRIYADERVEHFEVTGRNKSITVRSNRPLLLSKGIKHRKPDYVLIAGQIQTAGVVAVIIEALHERVKRLREG